MTSKTDPDKAIIVIISDISPDHVVPICRRVFRIRTLIDDDTNLAHTTCIYMYTVWHDGKRGTFTRSEYDSESYVCIYICVLHHWSPSMHSDSRFSLGHVTDRKLPIPHLARLSRWPSRVSVYAIRDSVISRFPVTCREQNTYTQSSGGPIYVYTSNATSLATVNHATHIYYHKCPQFVPRINPFCKSLERSYVIAFSLSYSPLFHTSTSLFLFYLNPFIIFAL